MLRCILHIMEAKAQKQIIDYFSYFEEFHNTARACLKDCQNCAASLNKLIKRCKNVKEAVVSKSPLGEFENLQSNLCASLHNLISEEIQELRIKLQTLEDSFEKLCHKNNTLRETCREIDFEDKSLLVRGTPFQPPLNQLLELADDTITFGSQVCSQIDTSIKVVTYKELDTESLVDNLRINTSWQRRLAEIIQYTSFLTENQI